MGSTVNEKVTKLVAEFEIKNVKLSYETTRKKLTMMESTHMLLICVVLMKGGWMQF